MLTYFIIREKETKRYIEIFENILHIPLNFH